MSNNSQISNLALHILLALGSGPLHGYGIGKDVEHRSGGALNPATGNLYQNLRRLTDRGLIQEAQVAHPQDPRRQYFTLTPSGRQALAHEANRLDALAAAAKALGQAP